ncbi:hypothetical protein [Streptomyces sp. 5-10]|uniref:TIGR03943 family putative permease subunit n=1 Tax=Streptomyces sp. 5-10 TaxID=878925 RepID=UPI00351A83C7
MHGDVEAEGAGGPRTPGGLRPPGGLRTAARFVTPGRHGTWYVSRLVISCCAADAQVRKVRVHGAPAPPADAWVTVTGTWHPTGKVGTEGASPALDATAVRRVPAPKDPYHDMVTGPGGG